MENNQLSPEAMARLLNYIPDEDEQEIDEALFAAKVQWHPVDIMEMHPGRFESIEEATEWLQDNESYIQEEMTSAGRDAILALI